MDTLVLIQFLISGISSGAIYALIALGFNVVQNATGIVNFAQGDFLVLGGFLAYSVLIKWHLSYILAFIFSILFTAITGLILDRLILAKARSHDVLILVFITVGASIFLRGIIKEIWGKRPISIPPLSSQEAIHLGSLTLMPQTVWIIVVSIVAFIILHFFFYHTKWGQAMRAIAVDREAASLVGINIPKMVAASFALAGAVGGLAGVLITPVTPISFESGVIMGLKGFAAAILGGYGSFGGALLGGLLLGLLEGLCAYFASSAYKDILAFAILVFVLLLRPQGILGIGTSERL